MDWYDDATGDDYGTDDAADALLAGLAAEGVDATDIATLRASGNADYAHGVMVACGRSDWAVPALYWLRDMAGLPAFC